MNRIGRRTIKCMLLIVVIFALMPDALADNLAGQASVIDGDTLEIHGTRIRLWGIDAPETGRNIRKANSTRSNAKPTTRAEECGRALMSNRGYTAPASEPVGDQQTAPTTRMLTLDGRSNAETPPSVSIGRGHLLSEATPLRTACVHSA
jgi:hypothetical protein